MSELSLFYKMLKILTIRFFLQVPEKKLKMVMADKELYKVCAVEVKRQIWQDNQALFGDEVSPLLKQYIVEKEAALFSSDLSILHNFFSPSPKTRRQGEVSERQQISRKPKLTVPNAERSVRYRWS